MRTLLSCLLFLSLVTFAAAAPPHIPTDPFDGMCPLTRYNADDQFDCQRHLARYRMTKQHLFSAESCIEARLVQAWYLAHLDELHYRMFTVLSTLECAKIGQVRP